MSKLDVLLWAAAISKVSLLLTAVVTAFMVNLVLGAVAVVSLVAYLVSMYLAELTIHDEGAKQIDQMMRDYAKSIGGGTA